MIDIAVTTLKKEYEVGSPILDGVTFQVNSGERVGLLGKNGAGKTTLFRILTGEERADSGEVMIAPGRRLGLISQIPVYPPDYRVNDVLETAFSHIRAMEEELKALTQSMQDDNDPALLRKYDALTAQYEAADGYETDMRLHKVCNGLGISGEMREKLFQSLSGGEKTRINLARLLLVDTDILLLDEPTNHLDLNATQWLEDYLTKYKGTILAISHDRYFLDKVIGRAIELKDGKAEFYQGNYSFYAIEKEKRYLEQLRQYQKEQAKLQQLQTAADKLHLWAFMGNDKLHKRAFSIEKRMERLNQTNKPKKERQLSVKFGETLFQGDDFFSVEALSKSFGQQALFQDLSLTIEGGDRIALLGDNGTGKSTLLKIMLGELDPEEGRLQKGPTVKLGYLPQQIRWNSPERNLIDTMLYEANCSTQEARDRLAGFQFRGEDAFKQVKSLSGGEQSRLRLCMLMDNKINFLVLDEPTNHLDLSSREWIEEAVEDYEGTLLFVSHDRYFIDRFANRIWVLEGGKIRDFRGDYQSYLAMQEREKTLPPPMRKSQKEQPEAPKPKKQTGGTKLLKKDLAALEKKLEKAESCLKQLEQEKEENASDYKVLEELMEKEAAAAGEYEALFDQWAQLEEALKEMEAAESEK